ncbi:MAG: hypothetical protein RR743_00585, partial [Oscillospiraceae bacterium]
ISGLHAANYDITHVFIDNFFKMLDEPDMDKVADLLDKLDVFGAKENINFTISATADPTTVNDRIKKYF